MNKLLTNFKTECKIYPMNEGLLTSVGTPFFSAEKFFWRGDMVMAKFFEKFEELYQLIWKFLYDTVLKGLK